MVTCYGSTLYQWGDKALGLEGALLRLDELDGGQDGGFFEPASDSVYAETRLNLCELTGQFDTTCHRDEDLRPWRFKEMANAFSSFFNLVNAKKNYVTPLMRDALVNMQLSFATFLNDAVNLDSDEWLKQTLLSSGKYYFWGPTVRGVFTEDQWRILARWRTTPWPQGVEALYCTPIFESTMRPANFESTFGPDCR